MMFERTLLVSLLLNWVGSDAFLGQPLTSRTFVQRPTSSTTAGGLYMGGGKGVATTRSGKEATISKVKGLLDSSEMIITVPASSLTVKEVQDLRQSLPESTTMSVVKNKLMAIAVEGTDYEATTSLLKGPNMWFFIEDDIGGTIDAFNKFCKENGKKESHEIMGGVCDGTAYDAKGVEAISKLPSKPELYAKIAGSVKSVPTKLARVLDQMPTRVARVIKAPNAKLVKAIKLATMPEE